MKKILLTLIIIPISNLTTASIIHPPTDQQSEQIQQEQWVETLQKQSHQTTQAQEHSANQTTVPTITNQDLIQNPELLTALMQQAIDTKQQDLLTSLSEAYAMLPEQHQNPAMRQQASGTLAYLKKDYKSAIKIYNNLLQEIPENPRIRLDLAAMQFEDKQWSESLNHFNTVFSQPETPKNVKYNIARFQNTIRNTTAWQLNAGLTPTRQSNINDAPPKYCISNRVCSTETPVSATGLSYHLGISKLMPLKTNHNLIFQSHINGTSYFLDKKSEYDHAFSRIHLGWQWQDYRHSLSIKPFYQAQFGGSDDFSSKPKKSKRVLPYMLNHGIGAQIAYTHTHSNKMQSQYSFERYAVDYREANRAKLNNGLQDSSYTSLAYQITPDMLLIGSYQFNRFIPKHKQIHSKQNNAAYNRHAFSLGWIQHWKHTGGLESSIFYTQAKRNYKGIASLSNESQRNKETTWNISLSHNKLSYKGFKPKLNFHRYTVNSNQAWATRKNTNLSVTVEKNF